MKRVLAVFLLFLLLTCVVALSDGSKVWVNPQLWDQDANERLPIGPGYPVLAITQVIDGEIDLAAWITEHGLTEAVLCPGS